MIVLVLGSGLAKVVAFLAIPIITRIYEPSAFGELSIFMAIVAIVSPLLSLRYLMAIPIVKSDRVAINILFLCFCFVTINTVALAAFVYIGYDILLNIRFFSNTSPNISMLFIAIYLTSISELLILWGTRKKKFTILSKSLVFQSLLGVLVKIALGLLNIKELGLIIGQIVQQGSGSILLAKNFASDINKLIKDISVKKIILLTCYFSDLPKFRLPSQVLLVIATQLPILFCAAIYNESTTGQLGLALTTLAIPIQLFGNSTGKVYFSEVSSIGKYNKSVIRSVTNKLVIRLFLFSLFPTVTLAFFGEYLFVKIFGSNWQLAGNIAEIIAISLMFQFISMPIVNLLTVLEKQKTFLIINAMRMLLVLLALSTSYIMTASVETMMIIYSGALSLSYICTLLIIYKNMR
ncbi:lipopolysaccharide biosynthesis protein [Methylophaga sp.]|uniref:lipopolysaccharide biosynthesis protein n=1 Tax=Methylophaga sp. TaxID=2024840 RepID=UPI003A934595